MGARAGAWSSPRARGKASRDSDPASSGKRPSPRVNRPAAHSVIAPDAVSPRPTAQRRADPWGPAQGPPSHGVPLRRAARRAVPKRQIRGRPVLGLPGVAGRAGIGRADRRRDIGTGDAECVVAPPIHAHVGHRWHVAGDAFRPRATRRVPMMLRHIEARGQVALRADGIALRAQATAVRVMAVGADDTGALHAALREGSPFEDLALDLAIRMIVARRQQHRRVSAEEARAGQRAGHDRAGAGMAGCAHLDLRGGHLARRTVPARNAPAARHRPAPRPAPRSYRPRRSRGRIRSRR
jgi:hypothetical protein